MAIVVDTNVFARVFDPTNKEHAEFALVKSWIERGDGFLVFGGTRYIAELAQSIHRLRLVRRLKESGMAVQIDSGTVDAIDQEILRLTAGTACNDQHIMALLAAARCGLLCSLDAESYPFVKARNCYPKGCIKVRIYSSSRNADLLVRVDRATVRNAVL